MGVRLECRCANGSYSFLKSFLFLLSPRTAIRLIVTLGVTGAILSLPANALVSPTAQVGATPGSFAVSPSGAATYTIPIVVAPGVNGLQPNLALVYNSQGGNGLLGIGWGLSGLSVVHRCGATIEIDGFKGGVNYDANDKFCLDGERLIHLGNGYYRTEKESLQKIIASDASTNPASFTVTSADSTVREYATSIEAAGNPSIRRLWVLSKVSDKNGNTITFAYDKTDVGVHGDYQPASISYAGGANTVVLQYAPRNDITPFYEGGYVTRTLKLLTNVASYANGTKVREYRLRYDTNGAVGRSRLISAQECGTDGACLPAQTFIWTHAGDGTFNSPVGGQLMAANFGTYDAYSRLTGDVNGDGITDLIAMYTGSSGMHAYTASSKSGRADLLASITSGLGVVTNISYKYLTAVSVYTKDPSTSYPYQSIQDATHVVAQFVISNGIGGTNNTIYKYGGLKNHVIANKSLGFRWIQTADAAGLINVTYYNQNREAGIDGTVALIQTFANGIAIKGVTNTWINRAGDGACTRRHQAQLVSSTETTRELNNTVVTTATTSNTYDGCGYPTQTIVDMGGGHRKITVNQYAHDTANWRLGLVTRTEVISEAPGQTPQTRVATFDYDYLGRLTTEIVAPGTALALTTTYENYDAYGHWTRRTVSGADIEPRSESQTFDARGLFVATKTNALGHTSSFEYDPRNGQPTRITDANGLSTTMDYDGFGRKGIETRPDGVTTRITYAATGAGYSIQTQTDGAGDIYVFHDILGRPIRTSTQAFGGNWIYQDTTYDALGRVSRKSHPYLAGESPHYTAMTYDVVGRVKSVTTPGTGARTTTTDYNGLSTTVTNPLGQPKTTVKDVQGRTVSVTDNAGTVYYQYDAVGNLTQVTGVDNAVTAMQYDARGRKIAMQDPDMGSWTYAYDVLGQLKSQRDAKGQTISMTYDKLGRMLSKTTPEASSTWTYDTAARGTTGQPALGKLAAAAKSTDNYSESYTYDHLGRTKTATINAGSAYTTAYDYDAYGRVEYITYPSTMYKVRQRYDAFGYLYQVVRAKPDGSESLIWQADIGDAHARIIKEMYGNGLIGQRNYNHETGELETIQTGTNASPASVQNLSYDSDAINRLLTRTDAILGLTETFEYDNVNRLRRATAQSATANVIKTYDYSPNGNLIYKSDVGTYAYGSSRPHAVTSVQGIVNATYAYDANGNMLTGGGRTITYTSFNKPKTIFGASDTTNLYYDVNDNRFFKSTDTKDILYVGKLYERVVGGGLTEHKHYIYGGNNLVATYTERNNGTPPEMRYVHTDHLDSVNVITDDNGNVVQRLSFDPFGKRRNPDGSDATGPIASSINRGYTRHEHDDEVGLINMNARLYDPLIARFITPDTIVPGAGDGQAYNRYSYVRNNPLSLVDPSGHSWLSKGWRRLKKNVKRLTSNIVRAHTTVLRAMHSRPALAAVAAYATGGAMSGYFTSTTTPTMFAAATGVEGAMQLTAIGQVTVGGVAGGVGGWTSAGNSEGALYGAISGGFGGYLSAGTGYANQVTQASKLINNVAAGEFGAVASTLGNTAMSYAFSRVEASIAAHYGMSPEAFNVGLMGLSIMGNEMLGSRFRSDGRFSSTENRGFLGFTSRGGAGIFFDVVDTMLGYQGLPTASTRDYLVSPYAGLSVSGHSLGTLDASYVTANGLSPGGAVYSLPFGNVAPAGLTVNLGAWDAVNGGYLGRVFNPGASMCSVGFGGHSLSSYAAGC